MDNDAWKSLLDQVLVVDTDSHFVYLGTLAGVEDHFVIMKNVDVHDRTEGPSTKEQYVMEAKRFGIKPNRKEVSVRKVQVVSVSRLDDVILY